MIVKEDWLPLDNEVLVNGKQDPNFNRKILRVYQNMKFADENGKKTLELSITQIGVGQRHFVLSLLRPSSIRLFYNKTLTANSLAVLNKPIFYEYNR